MRTDLVFTNSRASVMLPGRPEVEIGFHSAPEGLRSGSQYAYIQVQPVKDFVDAVLDDQEPAVTPEEGLEAVAMIVAVDRSIEAGKPIRVSSVLESA